MKGEILKGYLAGGRYFSDVGEAFKYAKKTARRISGGVAVAPVKINIMKEEIYVSGDASIQEVKKRLGKVY